MKRKVIFQRQLDSMQCGVAALTMVCRHFGADYTLDFIGQYCHATTEGVSMLGISQAANTLGLDTMAAKVTISQLSEAPLPCILHWNQNHFVVLHRISRNGRRFHIADPGKGLRRLDREEFSDQWLSTVSGGERKGVALFLEPNERFGSIMEEKRATFLPFHDGVSAAI